MRLEKHTYANGRTLLALMDADDGEQVACATVNLPDQDLQPGEVFIKTWSENEQSDKSDGMLPFLLVNGIVQDTGREVPTGFVKARACRLLI